MLENKVLEDIQSPEIDQQILCEELKIDPNFFEKVETQAEEDWETLKPFFWEAIDCFNSSEKKIEYSEKEKNALKKLLNESEENLKKLQNFLIHTNKNSCNTEEIDKFVENNVINLITIFVARDNLETAILEMEKQSKNPFSSPDRLSPELESLIVKERVSVPFLFYYQDFFEKKRSKKKSKLKSSFGPHTKWIQHVEREINDVFFDNLISEEVSDENYLLLLPTLISYKEINSFQKNEKREISLNALKKLISLLIIRETRHQYSFKDFIKKNLFIQIWKEWCQSHLELLRDENSETHKAFIDIWGEIKQLPLFLKKIILTKNELNPQSKKKKKKRHPVSSTIKKTKKTIDETINPPLCPEKQLVCKIPQITTSDENSLIFELQNEDILEKNSDLFLYVKIGKKLWTPLNIKDHQILLENFGIKPGNNTVSFRFAPDVNSPKKQFPPTEDFKINIPKPEKPTNDFNSPHIPTPPLKDYCETRKKIEAIIKKDPTPETTLLKLSPEEDAMEELALHLMENGNKRTFINSADFDWSSETVHIKVPQTLFSIENIPLLVFQHTPEINPLSPMVIPRELTEILIKLIKKEKEKREIEQEKIKNPELVNHLNKGNKNTSSLNQWKRENPEKDIDILKKFTSRQALDIKTYFNSLRENYKSANITLSLNLGEPCQLILSIKEFEIKIPFGPKGINHTNIESNSPHNAWKNFLFNLGQGVIAQLINHFIPASELPSLPSKKKQTTLWKTLKNKESRIVRYDEIGVFQGSDPQQEDQPLETLLKKARSGELIEILVRDENINFQRKGTPSNTPTPKRLSISTKKIRTQKYLIRRLIRTAKNICPGYERCPEEKEKTKIHNPLIQNIALQILQENNIDSWETFIEILQKISPSEFLETYPTVITSFIDTLIQEEFRVSYESSQTVNILTLKELLNEPSTTS
ncbi:hypothetical protein KAI58_04525 [Candidatus Gracilibacteria bacterium]|nr:hypothetical protein [Candidatus Gracilibacteria bacterium]